MTRKELPDGDLLFPQESYAIMGAAFEVYKTLGPGFLESVYEAALLWELQQRKVPCRSQVPIPVRYKDIILPKHFQCDILACDRIILELKAIHRLTAIEEAQALNYLRASGHRLAIILNFAATDKLEYKRIVLT